jgi:aspartokinase-like uncharacterized kinase
VIVLVCGGRDFADRDKLFRELDAIYAENRITKLIHGGARGADSLAGLWAATRGVPYQVFPANWEEGKNAGPRRNQKMLTEGKPDLVVAFPGGRGTADMVRRAYAANVIVKEIL